MTEFIPVNINIHSERDLIGLVPEPRKGVNGFSALAYRDGGFTWIPDNFFSGWRNFSNTVGQFYIGKCSGFGTESFVRYTAPTQSLHIGRYVSGGVGIIFMCSGFHETRTISTCEFGSYDNEMRHVGQREYGEIVVKNDVWFGDECMIMADSVIENGCILGARTLAPLHFRSEPFGIYAGAPAKLKKFRFPEKVRELLLDIAWWDMPLAWVKENNKFFLHDMTSDSAIDVLQELKAKKNG